MALYPVRYSLPTEKDVLIKGLRRAGYRLGYASKWHVNQHEDPTAFGFEKYVSLGNYQKYRSSDHLYNEWIVYWLTGNLKRAAQAPGRMNTPW